MRSTSRADEGREREWSSPNKDGCSSSASVGSSLFEAEGVGVAMNGGLGRVCVRTTDGLTLCVCFSVCWYVQLSFFSHWPGQLCGIHIYTPSQEHDDTRAIVTRNEMLTVINVIRTILVQRLEKESKKKRELRSAASEEVLCFSAEVMEKERDEAGNQQA